MRAILLLLLFLAGPAFGGAWPREPGEIYVSIGHEGDADGWTGLYAEWGGARRLTYGIDAGGHVANGIGAVAAGLLPGEDTDGRVMSFVRIPIVSNGEREFFPDWLVAVEVGLGTDLDPGTEQLIEQTFRLRLGLSVSRSLKTPLGDGWTSIDIRAEPSRADTRLGLLSVVGVKPRERLAVEMGLFFERDGDDDPSIALAPTVQYTVPKVGDLRVGVSLKSDGEASFRIGIARTF